MAFNQFPVKGGIPSGNTAARPSSPVIGDTYYNGQLGILEIYNGSSWIVASSVPGVPSVSVADVGTSRAYGSGQATVTITSATNGGSVSTYNVTGTDGTNTYTSGATTATTVTLTVGNSGTYNFTAVGSNTFGTGVAAANYSLAITTVPQAPTLSATATTSTITLTVGGSNGGKAITNFEYSTNGGSTYTALSPAQTAGPIVFTGLTQGTSYTYYIRAINANGTGLATSITKVTPYNVDYLVVGGGGGAGGYYYTGGAGGGAVTTGTYLITASTPYRVTVGAGGAQMDGPGTVGNDGVSSFFHTFEGFYGGKSRDGVAATAAGGAAATSSAGGRGGGTAADSNNSAGGGGGAGLAGGNGGAQAAGNGGNGVASSITGTSTYYGGGGGGSAYDNYARGTGGLGGGGNGTKGTNTAIAGSAGTANTGGGGGGASHPANGVQYGYGWAGGSGVVIIKAPSAGTLTFSGGVTQTSATSGSFKIYTITAAGTSDTVTFS